MLCLENPGPFDTLRHETPSRPEADISRLLAWIYRTTILAREGYLYLPFNDPNAHVVFKVSGFLCSPHWRCCCSRVLELIANETHPAILRRECTVCIPRCFQDNGFGSRREVENWIEFWLTRRGDGRESIESDTLLGLNGIVNAA